MEMPIKYRSLNNAGRSYSYNVLDFGAIGNGSTKDSAAIQQTIDECARNGGGTVYVPAGTYLTGRICLRSHITLFLDAGATLLFSDDFQEYPPEQTRWEGVECYGFSPLMYGKNLENVSLIGRGTLDGQGGPWWNERENRRREGKNRPETEIEKRLAMLNTDYETAGSGGGGRETQFLRPPLVQFMNCTNVLLEGLTHQNSPFWNTHLVYCDNVLIQNVTFKNPPNAPNTDGLDIDSCRNIRVDNCVFDVGDDCLCLKSGIDEDGRRVGRPTENVTITNCTMLHGHGGVVIGSEIAGDVRNVTISNSLFLGTDRGIRIKARRGRGGIVEDIRVNNILMKHVLSPLILNMFYRCGAKPDDVCFSTEPQPVNETTPVFRNISLSNITARDVQAAAGFLHGLPEMPIQALHLYDMTIEMSRELQEVIEPPAMMYGLEPMTGKGMWGKYLKRCSLNHLTIETREGEGILLQESQEIDIHAVSMKNMSQNTPGIILNQVENAYIHGCRDMAFRKDVVALAGDRTRDIIVI